MRQFEERLKALQEAEHVYDIVSHAMLSVEKSIPDESLALVDRLMGGESDQGHLVSAKRRLDELDRLLDTWDEMLEQERLDICCAALGLEIGDILVAQTRKNQSVRMKLDRASLHVDDEGEVAFHLYGRRYRKDGILGKRDEYIVINGGRVYG